jgi:GDPmannose 4,6-dehydratase
VQQDTLTEACIGTGKAYPVQKWLELCFSLVGKNWDDHVQVNTGYVADFQILVSNPSAINAIGWSATTGIKELATLMLAQTS